MRLVVLMLTAMAVASAQKVDLSSLDKLSEKAKESANVNLDKNQLGMASGVLSKNDQSQAKAKALIEGLNGVYVRVFEFEGAGQYAMTDLDAVRAQVRGAGWTKIVEVKEKNEAVEIHTYNPGKPDQGMLIVAAEPNELAVVNILGPIDLSKVGQFGALKNLPGMPKAAGAASAPKPAPKAPKPAPQAAPKPD